MAVGYLEQLAVRFDLAARADDKKLRATFAKLKIKPWPALLEILPSTVSAAAGAKKLRLPLIRAASDTFERVWQSDKLTVWKSTHDVRVFAKSDAALNKALAALQPS